MANNKTLLGQFAERLLMADSYNDAFQSLETFVQALDFDAVLYTYIPRIALDNRLPKNPVYTVSADFSAEYLSHYMEARFDQNDPIVKAIDAGSLGLLDWWGEVNKGYMKPLEKLVIETAREDYGIRNGLTLSVLSAEQGIAGASVTCDQQPRFYHNLKKENLSSLQSGVQLFHMAVMTTSWRQRHFILPLIGRLNSTEIGVLRGLTNGLTAQEICRDVMRSHRHIDNVIRNLRIKIGGETETANPIISKNELIYTAGLLNLLDGY